MAKQITQERRDEQMQILKTELRHVFERDLSRTKFEVYYTDAVNNDVFDGFKANVYTENTDMAELKIAEIYGWYIFNLCMEDGFIKIGLYHYKHKDNKE